MTANDLKLYHSASSPNSRRVRIFLAEKGLTVPLVPIDLAKGEQHSDAYRVINPRRVVPTLVLEDGTAIGEVLAIWRYLEEAYPTPPLLGSTPKDKALVTMWVPPVTTRSRCCATSVSSRTASTIWRQSSGVAILPTYRTAAWSVFRSSRVWSRCSPNGCNNIGERGVSIEKK
jgi:Glutathione S-transferase, N-terminal domain